MFTSLYLEKRKNSLFLIDTLGKDKDIYHL